MHVGDTIFIFCLALILFGPKKLPEIGRQIGKLMVEFRRASNEFKMQIEEELRVSEESERQKEIAAAASAPASVSASSLPATSPSIDMPGASTPVIAPPITGLPVNHTFPSIDPSGEPPFAESIPPLSMDAYPETANGFNPGLNTASNSEIGGSEPGAGTAQLAGAGTSPAAELFPTERFEPASPLAVETRPVAEAPESITEGQEIQNIQAPVHHG